MSKQRRLDPDALPDPRCLFCGESFDPDAEEDCPARIAGRCHA